MKRLFALGLVALSLCLGNAYAFQPDEVISGVSKTADGAITTNAGYFYGVAIATDETNQVDVSLYNSGTTSVVSDLVIPTIRVPGTTRNKEVWLPAPVPFSGLYLDITTSGTTHEVLFYYRER